MQTSIDDILKKANTSTQIAKQVRISLLTNSWAKSFTNPNDEDDDLIDAHTWYNFVLNKLNSDDAKKFIEFMK